MDKRLKGQREHTGLADKDVMAQKVLDNYRDEFLKFLEDMKEAKDCDDFKLTLGPGLMEFAYTREEKDDSDNRLDTA